MKKLIGIAILLIVVSSMSFAQVWFQASVEHKFNAPAGLTISNEVGYNLTSLPFVLSPSVDYSYYSNGNTTETLLFKCATASYFFKTSGVLPYVSVTGTHLTKYADKTETSLGYSGQLGVAFDLNANAQFFFQYRYFKYTTVLEGQLTQFGIMYIF